MCRFLVYTGEPIVLSDLLYTPVHSIVKQGYAAHDEEDRVNADGFGVGWYVPEISPVPALFRSAQPIWTSPSLRSVSSLTRTGLVFAHVRAASEGLEVSEANSHPFSSGPYLWMHNGTLGAHAKFRDWARRFLSFGAAANLRGTTDSEQLFALFLDFLAQASGSRDSASGLADILRKTVRFLEDFQRETDVREPTTLNLALTDGQSVLATRHALGSNKPPPSLHYASGVRLVPGSAGLSFEPAPGRGAVLMASEPIFPHVSWREVPPGAMLLARPDEPLEILTL